MLSPSRVVPPDEKACFFSIVWSFAEICKEAGDSLLNGFHDMRACCVVLLYDRLVVLGSLALVLHM